MGLAGALFAHKIGFLAPDIFSVLLSIQLLLMVVVGGLGSLHGAVYGAMFVAILPVLISQARDSVPAWQGLHRVVKPPRLQPRPVRLLLVPFIPFHPPRLPGPLSQLQT